MKIQNKFALVIAINYFDTNSELYGCINDGINITQSQAPAEEMLKSNINGLPGGFNAESSNPFAAATPYAPETVSSTEFGLKGKYFNNRMMIMKCNVGMSTRLKR